MLHRLDNGDQTKCHLVLYRNVENAADIRRLIMEGQVEASLIKPEMVVDTFQVLVAANKAVRSFMAKKMTTRSVYAEVIFNLSITKNISDALTRFGLGDDNTDILAIVLDPDLDKKLEKLSGQIQGHVAPIEELASLSDVSKIKEYYKVNEEELRISSLVDAVVCRMACKDFHGK